jgi:hypothetical protein
MIVRFKKEMYSDAPNLWYAFSDDNTINGIITPLKFYDKSEADRIVDELRKQEFFDFNFEERMFAEDSFYFCLYLTFDSELDEDRFIVWASGGVDV